MKKTVVVVITALSLVFAEVRPASALIIDASTLAAKISEWVQKIAEATNKIAQQGVQTELFDIQGFNMDSLRDLVLKYGRQEAKILISGKMKKLIKARKEKDKKAMEREQKDYKDGKNEYYDQKIEMAEASINEIETQTAAKNARLGAVKAELETLYMDLATAKAQAEADPRRDSDVMQIENKIFVLESEKKELESAIYELEVMLLDVENQRDRIKEEKDKVGTSEDAEYTMYQNRIEKMESIADDDPGFVNPGDETSKDQRWDDTTLMEHYKLTEQHFEDFMDRYFYDPNTLSGTDDAARVAHQSKIDEINRQRRYLLTNSAAHLLQVTATLRREIDVRKRTNDEVYQNIEKASGEQEAITTYSQSRIENAKAILMYAKLQAARLQYMAARELLSLSVDKVPHAPYAEFNLEKYILTKEEVDELEKKANNLEEGN